jgi:hypothetical protein
MPEDSYDSNLHIKCHLPCLGADDGPTVFTLSVEKHGRTNGLAIRCLASNTTRNKTKYYYFCDIQHKTSALQLFYTTALSELQQMDFETEQDLLFYMSKGPLSELQTEADQIGPISIPFCKASEVYDVFRRKEGQVLLQMLEICCATRICAC